VCFFSTKAFLISAIIIAKIVYLGFLVSRVNKVAPIMWIFKVLSELKLFSVSYTDSYLSLNLVLVLDLNSNSLNIFFMVEYQFF